MKKVPPVNGMRPIHPGEVLREEFLHPFGLTAHAPARFLGSSAEFWMRLQTDYEMARVFHQGPQHSRCTNDHV